MEEGWISIYRKIRENWIWLDKEPFDRRSAWIDLILSANHKDKKILIDNNFVIVKRGQFLTSEYKLAEKWKWGRKAVQNFLKLLENDHMIKKLVQPKKFTIIEVTNYEDYQNGTTKEATETVSSESVDDNKGTTNGTTEELQQNYSGTRQELQRNLNNNDNNVNNDNNDNNKDICVDGTEPSQNNITPAENVPGSKDTVKGTGAQSKKTGKGDYTKEFEEFWNIYPRRIEKKAAFKAWSTRIAAKVNPEDMIKACLNYGSHCRAENTEERFIKHAATFLGPNEPFRDFINNSHISSGRKNDLSKKGGQSSNGNGNGSGEQSKLDQLFTRDKF